MRLLIEWDGSSPDFAPLVAASASNFAHYTAFRVSASGTVRGLPLHLDRLTRDSETLFGRSLEVDFVLGSLRRVAAEAERPVMLRATVFGPELHLLVSTRGPSPLPPNGLRVRTVEWTRDVPRIKHTGLFASTVQRNLAVSAGFDDALFVTRTGLVSEGPTWNVAVLFGGELVWPDDECLRGTTRALLQRAADAAGLPWTSRSVSLDELKTAKAAFATSAGLGLRPVTMIDGRELPGDPALTATLQQAYADLPGDQLL